MKEVHQSSLGGHGSQPCKSMVVFSGLSIGLFSLVQSRTSYHATLERSAFQVRGMRPARNASKAQIREQGCRS